MPDYPLIEFEIKIPGQEPRTVALREPVIKVGNLSAAGLRLDHKGVSRMHAYIQVDGDDVYISDLGSRRGTFVNDQRVNKAKLQDGDVVRLGEAEVTVTFPEQPRREHERLKARVEKTFEEAKRPKTIGDLKRKLGLSSSVPQRPYRPARDGEGYLWRLFLEHKTLTLSEIEKWHRENGVGGWGYICECLGFMITDGAIVEDGDTYRIDQDELEAHERRVKESAKKRSQVYYCEQCFHTRGEIVEMGLKLGRAVCPNCDGEWKLNRGQARHIVSLKLQQYRALAEQLGILEQEDSAYQKMMEAVRAVMVKVQQHLDGDTGAVEQLASILAKMAGGENPVKRMSNKQ